ncbi:unnamed protein product [Durusdinium trenchii]|uniref:Kringle domain-containing protein n=2 Tax=Durusdinium trenchii TaxID=1381693 RepID=A0ABP0Q4H7_9DINO
MGSCCSCCRSSKEEEQDRKFKKGGDNDLSNGPITKRSCTDWWCLIVLLAAWVAYIVVTVAGLQDGAPAKLYLPRDYSGAYCNFEDNWNGGPNLAGFEYLSYTMNATATTDVIVKQLLCSSAVSDFFQTFYASNPATYQEYLCACCLSPCAKCEGSFDVGGDLTSGNLESTMTNKLGELKGAANPSGLFTGGGANGDVFSNMWSEATKYFNLVCLPSCNVNFDSVNSSTDSAIREWTYTMSDDSDMKPFWEDLKSSGPTYIRDTITSQFKFKALPLSMCPYNESKCIPFPGVEFSELYYGYCSFSMSADVVNAMGTEATKVLESTGLASFQDSSTETLGKWMGDFEKSLPAYILVAFLSFLVGFIFMVLLRFLIGPCVWFAVFLVLLMLAVGGALCWVRSKQCAGAGLFETGQQVAVAVTVTATTAASQAISGQSVSEEMTGDGADYRGVQGRTKNGLLCEKWGEGNAAAYTTAAYPNSGLDNNFCRNPYNPSDVNKAATIWCFTTDTSIKWQTCTPVGIITPECTDGYAITNNEVRVVLEICGYILWVLAGIYVILVCCLLDRIRLAIAVNKVAAIFVKDTPRILLVPAIQALVGILWILVWALSASFLLSQVPDGYTPKGAYHTYDEAAGTATTPGACTDKWPTGSVYKSESCELVNGTYACWRCSPPRYVFDWRFAVSFFVFLWNNALNIAIGQCLIAGAVGVWFFTSNSQKGTRRVIAQSTWNVFRYHLGSLAFGSFIIAVIQFIRALMKYYEKQAKAVKNRVLVLVLKICGCIIWCFEKCVKFLNKNAYIQIALMGTNFCTSAKKAFFLILRNMFRFGTVAILGAMINVIGFLFIIAVSVALGYVILTGIYPEVAPAVSLVIYGVTAYVVAKLFMNVFGLAVDTTLQCFLACEEMDLQGDFVPSSMGRWLDKSKPIGGDEDDD